MKEKLRQIKNSINRSNNSKYGFLLSIVALVEIIMIISVSTFSWVETISSIKISNDGRTAAIDTYTYTDANVGVGPEFNQAIDLSNYFRASGNAHLSAASSADGVNFFFPKVAGFGSSATAYRKGTINDKNTNYISFSFKVTAKGNNQNFFFDNVPEFMADGESITDKNDIRVAINVADSNGNTESTRIYSYISGTAKVVADVDGEFVSDSAIYAFDDFIDNTSDSADKRLFSVDKDQTKIITITMWLQDFENIDDRNAYSGKTISASNFKIVTATKMTQITFVDKTSGFNSTTAPVKNTWQWVGNDDAKMWVRTASGQNFEMTKAVSTESGSAPKWTVSIPTEQMGDDNANMYFYRTASNVSSNPQNNYYNYWQTKFADNKNVNPVYSAYGSAQSNKLVNGTWGELSEIQLLGEDKNVLPTPSSATALNITQVTLKNSNNISVEMNYNNGNWRAYIPKDNASKNLTFSFRGYNISASNRDITENISKYFVTSSTTGYWHPPAEVRVYTYAPHSGRGAVKVSGGAENATSVKVTKGTQVTVTATPNDDYAFEGWYTDEECTVLASQGNSSSFTFTANSIEKPYTYYAKFQYNVRLTAVTDNIVSGVGGKVQINNNAAAAKVSAPVKDGSKVTLKAIPDTENYEFDGWYYKNNEQVKDESGNHIKNTTITINSLDSPIDYYAHFKVKHFTLKAYAATDGVSGEGKGGGVKFDTQSGYANYAEISVKYTDKAYFMASANGAEGYEFKGWYSDAKCTKRVCCTAVGACTHTSFEADKNSEYKTLYAKFELKKYTVRAVATVGTSTTASSSGGTVKITANSTSTSAGSDVNMVVTHGDTATFTAVANTSGGYKFVGWYDAAGKSVSTSAEFTTANGVSSPITYYARFSKGTTIYFTDYFAEETGYAAYAAYVYQNNSGIDGEWPGKLISPNGTIKTDEATGYCVYINESDKSGDFNVIINNNNNGKQYPSGNNVPGLLGTFGNTYFFNNTKSAGAKMDTFNPISVGVNAVTYDENGNKQTNGFSGGTVKVGFNTYNSAKTLSRQSGDTFYATPQPANGYEFDGWYTNANCTTKVVDSAVTGAEKKLKIVPTDGTTFYAKFVASASTNSKLYLKPNSNWISGTPRFAAYFMDSSKSTTKWVSMTSADNGYYEVVIPEGEWKYVIFCRMNGATTDNNWDNKWNQTSDLDIPTDGTNCYTIKDGTWDYGGGTWSKH